MILSPLSLLVERVFITSGIDAGKIVHSKACGECDQILGFRVISSFLFAVLFSFCCQPVVSTALCYDVNISCTCQNRYA